MVGKHHARPTLTDGQVPASCTEPGTCPLSFEKMAKAHELMGTRESKLAYESLVWTTLLKLAQQRKAKLRSKPFRTTALDSEHFSPVVWRGERSNVCQFSDRKSRMSID